MIKANLKKLKENKPLFIGVIILLSILVISIGLKAVDKLTGTNIVTSPDSKLKIVAEKVILSN